MGAFLDGYFVFLKFLRFSRKFSCRSKSGKAGSPDLSPVGCESRSGFESGSRFESRSGVNPGLSPSPNPDLNPVWVCIQVRIWVQVESESGSGANFLHMWNKWLFFSWSGCKMKKTLFWLELWMIDKEFVENRIATENLMKRELFSAVLSDKSLFNIWFCRVFEMIFRYARRNFRA